MMIKHILLLCGALLLAACSAEPEGDKPSGNGGGAQSSGQASSPAAKPSGAALYDLHCASCHGDDGNTSFPLNNDTLTFDEMVIATRDTMPRGNPSACGQECSETVTAYIKANIPRDGSAPAGPIDQPPAGIDFSKMTGKELYEADLGNGSCVSCHGINGEGVPGAGGSLMGEECHACTVSPAQLVAEIDVTMPLRSEHLCVDDCATKTAEYIYETFYGGNFSLSCDDGIQKASPMRRLNKAEIKY